MKKTNNKKYISHIGRDYTDFIKTEQDIKDFNQLVWHEKRTHKPLKECVVDVVESINLDRKLRGIPGKGAFIQADPMLN